jgi:site-specific DNA recombinase
MPTAHIYVRVSDLNGRNGDSFYSADDQEAQARALATSRGYEVGEVVVELDVSGGKSAKERKLEALIESCERAEAEAVIVFHFDRFTREHPYEAPQSLARLHKVGARLLDVANGFDSESEMGVQIAGLLMAQSHGYRERMKKSWAMSRERSIERGAFPAETPWGYMRDDDGRLLPDPALAPYVQEMFSRRAGGATFSDLARWFRDELVHAPRGGPSWSHSTLAQVLRNRVYLGEQKHGDFQKQGAHEAILTEAGFEAAQVAKPLRTPEAKAHSSGALLPGLARCAGCGHTLKIVTGYGGKLRYYCKGPYTSGPCPARCLVRVDELDPWVEEWFLRMVKDNVRVAGAVAAREKSAQTQQAVETAESELAAFVKLTSAMEAAHFKAGYEERARKLEAAKHVHAEALRETRAYGDTPNGDMLAAWPGLSIIHKRRLLAAFCDSVNVAKGQSTIVDRVEFVRDGVRLGT